MTVVYLSERNISVPVIPILITSVLVQMPDVRNLGVYILAFDGENFINASEIPIL